MVGSFKTENNGPGKVGMHPITTKEWEGKNSGFKRRDEQNIRTKETSFCDFIGYLYLQLKNKQLVLFTSCVLGYSCIEKACECSWYSYKEIYHGNRICSNVTITNHQHG